MATDTRERILDAALDLFAEEGFQGTTISAVERRVGLTAGTGSFYRHFPSKEALLHAAVDREVARCMTDISTARQSLPALDDPLEQRVAMLEIALRDLRRFDRLFRLMLTDGDRVPELRDAITTALQGPGTMLTWEDDPTTVLVLAALGGYHLFSLVQGRPFQGVDQDAFIAGLAALTDPGPGPVD
jgi:AcrR family transcriptional regulator